MASSGSLLYVSLLSRTQLDVKTEACSLFFEALVITRSTTDFSASFTVDEYFAINGSDEPYAPLKEIIKMTLPVKNQAVY